MTLIKAENLAVKLGGQQILRDIDFAIEAGEVVTILGPNGAGKSTLLRCIIGAMRPDQGVMHIAPDLRIGYVPQRLRIEMSLPLTARRFLNLPHPVPRDTLSEAVAHAGIEKTIDRQITDLSGGEVQRVLLARALINRPQLLILDEATQGLDHPASVSFYQQLETIRAVLGCAIIMVSHELHVVMAASDRVICLNGHICCQGSPRHVASSPEYRALFGPDPDHVMAIYRHRHDHHHDIGES